jgi:rRNA small subunit pseudouridine methyltransferase Nep1
VLRVILAGAELELVPPEIAGHPAVRMNLPAGRKPSEVLLDQNLHATASRPLPDGERRGRPDIVHYTLLALLESPLCKAGGLEVAVHTSANELIRVRPDTRLPRGEARMHGLLAKVLRDGRSQDKDPLVWVEGVGKPDKVLASFAKGPVVRLDEGGPPMAPADLARKAKGGDLTVVLGAFPSGDFHADWKAAVPDAASLWREPLNAWAVAAEVVAAWRAVHGPAWP